MPGIFCVVALDAHCRAIFFAVDVTGGIGGRSFFGSASKIRNTTYQGLVNVVEAARANEFAGRIVLLSGMGCDRPSLSGAILNALVAVAQLLSAPGGV